MIADVNLKLEKGFAVSEGPFVKGVEAALSSVQRQQYHGGAFIGNHVHKSLQVKWNNCNRVYIILIPLQDQHTHTLCTSLIDTALKHSPQLVEEATGLYEKYRTAFSLFS